MPETENLTQQFVNFIFYKIDPLWRRLSMKDKQEAKREFLSIFKECRNNVQIESYSLVGIRSDADFLLWRIAEKPDAFQEMSTTFNKTILGSFLQTSHSYLSMTKRSIYVDRHKHPGSESSRSRLNPGLAKYLFVYPFVKTRAWYLLSKDERQKMMNIHIEVGHKYKSVKLNTTYSFGLDDQEFVVAFETDSPADFLDLVMELRNAESSKYTLRDTPTFTCIRKSISDILEQLG